MSRASGKPRLGPLATVAAWLLESLLALKPPSRAPVWMWAEKYFEVVAGARAGQWRLRNSPWVRRLLEVFPDNRVSRIVVLCSAQSSKTESLILLLCWVIAEDPAGAMWVTAKTDDAEREMQERIEPAMHACGPVRAKLPTERGKKKANRIFFPGMVFEIGTAKSKGFLQGRVRRWLFLDEVRNWPRWALPMVLKRVTTWWNSRVVIATTPDTVGDTVDREFQKGSQEHLHPECPHCGRRVAELTWKYKAGEKLNPWHTAPHAGGIEWSTNEKTKPNGIWDIEEVAKTIRYIWPCCGAASFDHPVERQRIADSAVPVPYNPDALKCEGKNRARVSLTWSKLLVPWNTWAEVVEEFLVAVEHLKWGNIEPYKAFWTETLGKSWDPNLRTLDNEQALDGRKEDYDPLAPWDLEARRFLIFDVQEKGGRHPWAVWAFSTNGQARLLGCGRCASREDLDQIRIAYSVLDSNVAGDTAYDTTATYEMLLASGQSNITNTLWKGLRGEKAAHYRDSGGVQQPWRISDWIDPYHGTIKQGQSRPLRILLFSKAAMLDRLTAFQKGFGPGWNIPRHMRFPPNLPGRLLTLDEFVSEATAYEEQTERDSRGEVLRKWHQLREQDHQTSLAMMALVCAMAVGLYTPPPPVKPKPAPEAQNDDDGASG